MRFQVITLFPEMIELGTRFGVVGQAVKDGRLAITALSPRVFTSNVHQTVDDRPFGGGDGMVMIPEPLKSAIEKSREQAAPGAKLKVIHLSPRGRPFTDQVARELSEFDELILVASRYGGVDQRLLNDCVDDEISIGDYVLSGGELPALTVIDAVARLLPGVLGNESSPEEESFARGLLEHPQYTRPREWQGAEVPSDLLSGDHARIAAWRRKVSLLATAARRPELLDSVATEALQAKDVEAALRFLREVKGAELEVLGLGPGLVGAESALERLYERLPQKKGGRR